MKKVILSIIAIFIAQMVNAQVRIAPELGIGLAGMRTAAMIPEEMITKSMLAGGDAGLTFDIPLDKHIYFQPGLLFALKGARIKAQYPYSYASDTMIKDDEHYRLYYVQLPMNVVYKTGMPGHNRLVIGMGVYLAECVSVHYKLHEQLYDSTGTLLSDNTYNPTLKIGANKDVPGFDIGIDAVAGYEMHNGLSIKAYLNYGFNNVAPVADYITDKNIAFGIAISYFFKKEAKNPDNELVVP